MHEERRIAREARQLARREAGGFLHSELVDVVRLGTILVFVVVVFVCSIQFSATIASEFKTCWQL